jgi:hypothetical protein
MRENNNTEFKREYTADIKKTDGDKFETARSLTQDLTFRRGRQRVYSG